MVCVLNISGGKRLPLLHIRPEHPRGPTQPPLPWVSGLLPIHKAANAQHWTSTSSSTNIKHEQSYTTTASLHLCQSLHTVPSLQHYIYSLIWQFFFFQAPLQREHSIYKKKELILTLKYYMVLNMFIKHRGIRPYSKIKLFLSKTETEIWAQNLWCIHECQLQWGLKWAVPITVLT